MYPKILKKTYKSIYTKKKHIRRKKEKHLVKGKPSLVCGCWKRLKKKPKNVRNKISMKNVK